jgi:hypothetical protein
MFTAGPASLRRRFAPLLAAMVVVHACEMPTAPGFPESAIPFEPPPAYAMWWELTAACAGVNRDFDSVRWFVVPGARSIPYGDAEYQGLWYRAGNRIVLAEQSTRRGGLVRHEMLHALIERAAHPAEYYRRRCGGLVVCAGECATEAGPDAQASASMGKLSTEELDLTMEIVAGASGAVDGTGWVGVMVSATNPRLDARVVRLGATGARPPLPTFGYALAGPGSTSARETYEFALDTAMVFGPGETRRRLFDLWLPTSEWEVRGLFASGATSAVRFSVER